MKKIILSLVALACALILPISSADAAGNGSWDYVTTEPFELKDGYLWVTKKVSSTGGDFMIKSNCNFYTEVQLWEYDPGSENDDLVDTRSFGYGDEEIFRDINSFVDGSNDKAEFFVVRYDDYNDGKVKFYD
ncbi:hypothetical protein [Thalassobacillus pellis]|uniref:hypothetical protein n=1 Tax=Thalassobacillus pellis TaxID=748008 RepID=UPI00195F789E|nr:hypothetical protein [Thalassobacillus pellis]MBM7554563.1 hypothetical protein [Thalassobacillus pellis]